ncbi:MAG TPA: NAD-dependent epimerase/dehydratase family protein, partial [bacterium]|nr:NAD-dependent epimerase/dehydratase family protein [bacterium]
MRALVTGSHGFVGQHLRRVLHESGRTVIGLGRTPRAAPEREEYVCADLSTREDALRAARESSPDIVFHLAGDTGRFGPASPTLRTNVLGTMHLLEGLAARGAACRVLVIGTSAQYGRVPENENPITEATELRAEGAYGWSKSAAETLALSFHGREGLEVVAVRPFNHLGPGEPPEFVASSFARQVVEIETGGEPVLHTGNLTPIRDLTDVRDLVRGYVRLADSARGGEIYNLCSGRGVRIGDLLAMILDRSGVTAEVRPDPNRIRPGELAMQIGSAAKAERETGWRPEIPL